jgi:hypothetical protein
VRRVIGLVRVSTAPVSNWRRRFTLETLRPLRPFNHNLALDTMTRLNVPRLTLDVDGAAHRRHGHLGALRLQSPPLEPQLLLAQLPDGALSWGSGSEE